MIPPTSTSTSSTRIFRHWRDRTKNDRVKRLAKGPMRTVPQARPDSNRHAHVHAYESKLRTMRLPRAHLSKYYCHYVVVCMNSDLFSSIGVSLIVIITSATAEYVLSKYV